MSQQSQCGAVRVLPSPIEMRMPLEQTLGQ